MFKKMTVLAMAVGVVAAFALPASASAKWSHGGSPIQQNVQLGLTGNVGFQGPLGGLHCQVTSRVVFNADSTTGVAETFTPHPTSDTANCSGQGGLAFCQIHKLEPTGLPWQIHTKQTGVNTIEVTTGEIHSTVTGGFCPLERVTLTPGTVLITAEEQHVTNATLSGALQAHLQTRGQCNGQQSAGEVPPNCTHKFNGAVDTQQVQTTGTIQIEDPAQRATYTI